MYRQGGSQGTSIYIGQQVETCLKWLCTATPWEEVKDLKLLIVVLDFDSLSI